MVSLVFFFGRRGREGWAEMVKGMFAVNTDLEGHQYVHMTTTETTKNHQGGHKQKDINYNDQRMYGTGVEIFLFYMTKLNPKCERLFQNPLTKYDCNGIWFKNEPMGKNKLGCIMQHISQKAGLSEVYTCHSVRASTITTLFQAGVPAQNIITVSNHKDVSSLKHYIQDMSNEQKRSCSDILHNALHHDGP